MVRYIKYIYIRQTTLILQRHVNVHETLTEICLCQRRGASDHNKRNYERLVHLTNWIEKKQASAEPSAPCIPDTIARAWHKSHNWVGSYSKSDLVGGRSEPGYQKDKK